MSNPYPRQAQLEQILREHIGATIQVPARSIREVTRTTPNYIDALITTFGLSQGDLDSRVFRIGLGQKLSERDSDIYDDIDEDDLRQRVDQHLGIVFPRGMLVFHEDIFCSQRDEPRILAASYHFQTRPWVDDQRPLYVRFEFDPLMTPDYVTGDARRDFVRKPIFHYHFSNYALFHKDAHFPAGVFAVPSQRQPDHREVQAQLQKQHELGLREFLVLLKRAGLITAN